MRIGIIGAGYVGGTLARLLTGAGHQVIVSNSRGPESLQELVAELGPLATAGTGQDAVQGSDVVILAAHWRTTQALPEPAAVAGKIVIDTMNPYTADGGQFDLGDSTSSEETARRLPQARLVKAFNTIWYKHLASNGHKDLPVEQRHAIFVAGDYAEAKRVVSSLIEDIGFGPVDTGGLREGGLRQRVGSPLYNVPMTAAEGRTAVAKMNAAGLP